MQNRTNGFLHSIVDVKSLSPNLHSACINFLKS